MSLIISHSTTINIDAYPLKIIYHHHDKLILDIYLRCWYEWKYGLGMIEIEIFIDSFKYRPHNEVKQKTITYNGFIELVSVTYDWVKMRTVDPLFFAWVVPQSNFYVSTHTHCLLIAKKKYFHTNLGALLEYIRATKLFDDQNISCPNH